VADASVAACTARLETRTKELVRGARLKVINLKP